MKLSISIFKQFYITVIGSLIVIIICIAFLVIPGVKRLVENSNLRKIEEMYYNSSFGEIKKIDAQLNEYLYTGNQWEFQQQLMDLVSKSCSEQKVRLSELNSYGDDRTEISHHKIYEIKLRGKFSNLMSVVNKIQNELTGGSILSIQFYEEIDRRTKKKEIVNLLYVESISYISS